MKISHEDATAIIAAIERIDQALAQLAAAVRAASEERQSAPPARRPRVSLTIGPSGQMLREVPGGRK